MSQMHSTDSDDSPQNDPPDVPPPILLPPVPVRPTKFSSEPHEIPQSQGNTHFSPRREEGEDEDEVIPHQMTASYSEISFNSDDGRISLPQSRVGIDLDDIDTSTNLLEQIQRPVTLDCKSKITRDLRDDRNTTPNNNLYRLILAPQIQQVDPTVLADLETEAQRIATSIDNLTESLGGILHSISSITADNLDCYRDAVSKMSDAMDSNIKGMYTIIAKSEEVTNAMSAVQYHAERIKEIKRLVDVLDSNM